MWDFRGTEAEKTAEHHVIHLKQYIKIEKLGLNITGFSVINEFHSIAFLMAVLKRMQA